MRTRILGSVVTLLLVLGGGQAPALDIDLVLAREQAPPPEGAVLSENVEFIANVAGSAATAIAVNFIGDTMFVSTTVGVFSYDVSDPAAHIPVTHGRSHSAVSP